MARTIKNRLTTEERRAQAEALQGSIAEQVEQLRTSEQWLAFLRFAQSFHHYSLGNLLLIYVEHRAIAETEAESVAYVVAGLLGVDTSRYSIGYVAGWSAADADTIKTTATHVLHAARLLTDAITDDHTLTDKPEQY